MGIKLPKFDMDFTGKRCSSPKGDFGLSFLFVIMNFAVKKLRIINERLSGLPFHWQTSDLPYPGLRGVGCYGNPI